MTATPTALSQASNPPPGPAPGVQASAPKTVTIRPAKASVSGRKSVPKSVTKSPALGHSTKKPASRAEPTTKVGKLHVVKTQEKGRECWTVKTGKRGEKKPDFRIRLTDSGYRVMFRYYDEAGKRPERYCCYLSVREWKQAQSQSLANFVRLIAGKFETRYAAGDPDDGRYQEIAPRLNALI